MANKCCVMVPDRDGSIGEHQCNRKPVEMVDGDWFCPIHHPARVKARNALDDKRRRVRYLAGVHQQRLSEAAPKCLEACRELVRWYEQGITREPKIVVAMARNAIKIADGQ